jgi:CubicO group peptidase (beta-lactamase class C family)
MATWRTRLAWGLACAAIVTALAGLLQVRAQGPPSQAPPWAAQVDAVFSQWDRPDSPGCAIGVYQDGRTAYSRGYGMADLEHDAPMTPGSVFYAGSVSKQFTAMAAALAIKQRKLGPDDDVRKYVPELPEYGRPITIRHLLRHTSGLRDVSRGTHVSPQQAGHLTHPHARPHRCSGLAWPAGQAARVTRPPATRGALPQAARTGYRAQTCNGSLD